MHVVVSGDLVTEEVHYLHEVLLGQGGLVLGKDVKDVPIHCLLITYAFGKNGYDVQEGL